MVEEGEGKGMCDGCYSLRERFVYCVLESEREKGYVCWVFERER